MAYNHMKVCLTSYVIREIQIETSLRYRYIPIRWFKSKIWTTPNVGDDVEKQEHSFTAGVHAKWYTHFRRQFGDFL